MSVITKISYVLIISILMVTTVFSGRAVGNSLEKQYQYHLATKSPYRVVANTTANEFVLEGCQAQKIWMVTRHGTRNPDIRLIQKMRGRLSDIRDLIVQHNPTSTEHLDDTTLESLKKWKSPLNDSDEMVLAGEGEHEMFHLAQRMQKRFPQLLPRVYDNDTYFFKYTESQRTKASSRNFTIGLFGPEDAENVWYPEIAKNDPILEFYKLCTKWREEVKENPDSYRESRLFENSTYVSEAVTSLNKALNMVASTLSVDDVHSMYMTCAYETARSDREGSPWCKVLTFEAILVMEFWEDLKYFYRDGYGYELTYKQACRLFNDMVTFFESDDDSPKATLYFTHSGALLKLLAHLGLYNDHQPLTHQDFAKNSHKWKMSKIDAFGTNVAFILHKCGSEKYVTLFHQEHPTKLPDCDDKCNFEHVKEYYSETVFNCNFDEMCNN